MAQLSSGESCIGSQFYQEESAETRSLDEEMQANIIFELGMNLPLGMARE